MPENNILPELVGICKKIRYGVEETLVDDRGFTDLNPIMLGFEQLSAGKSYGPEKRDCHLIHFAVSGKGVFETSREKYEVHAGQCFLIRPNEITTYTADRLEPWTYIWIGLNGRLTVMLDELPDVFDAPDPSIFTSMLEYEGLDCDRELYLTGKCFLLLSSLRGYKRVVNESKYAGSSRYARAAAIFVVTTYMYPITVEKLAENLHVNRRYLSRVFKKEYGVTVKEYITSIRMDHAKTLLRSGRTVAETALLCGYNDTLGFSKMYRKHHGCPPSAERAPEQQIPAAETDIFNSTEPSRTEVYRDSYDRAKTSDVRDSAASAQALNPHAPAEPTQPENRTPTESARPENHTPAESARPEDRAPAEPAQPADIPPSEAPLSDTPSGVPESGHTAALEQEKLSNDR